MTAPANTARVKLREARVSLFSRCRRSARLLSRRTRMAIHPAIMPPRITFEIGLGTATKAGPGAMKFGCIEPRKILVPLSLVLSTPLWRPTVDWEPDIKGRDFERSRWQNRTGTGGGGHGS